MKQPKKLKRNQKELLSRKGYDAERYSLVSEGAEGYVFINRETKETVKINK